jgi:putative hydrolase of the HAD superfamily
MSLFRLKKRGFSVKNSEIMSIRAVIFDLDDTLYLERQYIKSGCKLVSELLTDDSSKRRELYDFMWDRFQERGEGRPFGDLLETYPELCNGHSSDHITEAYLDHVPDISLMPRMGSLLRKLSDSTVKLGVIADGSPAAGRRTLEALRLTDQIDIEVFTEEWGAAYRKPHERAFRHVTSELALRPQELAYVADDPGKDFRAPNVLGWRTVRLRLPYQLAFSSEYQEQEDRPSLVISDIRALQAFLEEACQIEGAVTMK